MNRDVFFSLLRTDFFPRLRAEGFRGSGATLRRIAGCTVHVFNVQGSSGGDRCYLNLGVHFDFLPTAGGGMAMAKNLSEAQCAFRTRLEPPEATALGWQYGATETEARTTIERIAAAWSSQAAAFFTSYSFPDGMRTQVLDDSEQEHPHQLLTLARVARHLGDHARAIQLAQTARPKVPVAATLLRAEIDALIGELQRP